MAAGEYVSVSSQADAERADLALEQRELRSDPVGEREELAEIYRMRGLSPELAEQVAAELSARDDVLAVHARDELGMTALSHARPVPGRRSVCGLVHRRGDAAAAGGDPGTVLASHRGDDGGNGRRPRGDRLGRGTHRRRTGPRGALRVVVWGVAAMALTMVVGRIVGTAV